METKDQLVGHIKKWISIDDEIKHLQKEIKERRQQKKELTSSLVEVMKTNEIDCFDINDGALVFTRNKVKAPLSKKTLISALAEYYGDNHEEIGKLSSHILNSRKETIKEGIRHKVENKK